VPRRRNEWRRNQTHKEATNERPHRTSHGDQQCRCRIESTTARPKEANAVARLGLFFTILPPLPV
jgi:hypothetical protein